MMSMKTDPSTISALVLDVLHARYRLGEPAWLFPYDVRLDVQGLVEDGLIEVEDRADLSRFKARLTPKGLLVVPPHYLAPVARLHALNNSRCAECGKAWPCPTRQMTDPAMR